MSDENGYLSHYGTPRHSGRYPWGSGDDPFQHTGSWLSVYNDMKSSGKFKSDTEIARALGMNTTQLRQRRKIELEGTRKEMYNKAAKLKAKGWSNTRIGEYMGMNESSVRSLLNPQSKARMEKTNLTEELLKEQVAKKTYLDVGAGVERQIGVSRETLNTAINQLKKSGKYEVHQFDVNQATNPGNKTHIMVLTPSDVDWKTTRKNREKIKSVDDQWIEDGTTMRNMKPPVSIKPERVKIRYAEEGGTMKDGVMELRPGVEDISLGADSYAQVRITVDNSHYLKGMAMYGDPKSFPKGVDIIFNTNKHVGTPMLGEKDHSVLKPLKNDPENPYGATIKRQRMYIGKDGKEHQSPINIVNDEEGWSNWAKTLSSQFLSKQKPALAKQQLTKTYNEKFEEFKEISELTNPVVKKHFLASFADDCDSAAVDLKASKFQGQATHVILPLTTISDKEIYAPNYKNGEEVILIRYPHGGTFEIPRLKVNNNNRDGKKYIGNAKNAVGINAKVAEQLSGADFDGDTVTVIPVRGNNFDTKPALKGLKDFDTKAAYPAYPGMKRVGPKSDGFRRGLEMGKVSNLITDMTIGGASEEELVRAVKHSMVVIDAEKHNLNWKQSAIDNNINELKAKYQKHKDNDGYGGAATLISKAKSETRFEGKKVPKKGYPRIGNDSVDPETGKIVYDIVPSTYNKRVKDKKTGEYRYEETPRSFTMTKMAATDDAFTLSSGTPIETIYAEHANRMKALANRARKEYLASDSYKYSPSAKKMYEPEVKSLTAKINMAKLNAPKERQAQLITDKEMELICKDNPDLRDDKEHYRKTASQTLAAARARTGASGRESRIHITDREWEAIQAGAISKTALETIVSNADQDELRQLATPRHESRISEAKINQAKSLLATGRYTQAEVAEATGLSVSYINKELA